MGPGNERGAGNELGGLGSWTVPSPWKLYFDPDWVECLAITVLHKICSAVV